MKVKELIAKLETIEEKYGDVEVVMASDSEGNSYSTIDNNVIHSKVYENEAGFLRAGYKGELRNGAYPDIVEKFYKSAKVVGVCLFPWSEGFEYAEDAVNFESRPEKVIKNL